MADSKLTALTEATAPEESDELYIVQDTSTTPVSRRISFFNLIVNYILDTARAYTKGQQTQQSDLTITAGAVTPNLSNNQSFSLDHSENVNWNNPTGMIAGASCAWDCEVTVTGAGNWDMTFGSAYSVDLTELPDIVTGTVFMIFFKTTKAGNTYVSFQEKI